MELTYKDKIINIDEINIKLVDDTLVLNDEFAIVYNTNNYEDLVDELVYNDITVDDITTALYDYEHYQILFEQYTNRYFLVTSY